LQPQGHLGDFIKEQRAAVASTKRPWRSVFAVEWAPRA